MNDAVDVAVIGAGVVGAAIARDLTRHGAACVLIDAATDVGTGTSKANTAILHTGFDAKPGSLEARLVPRGQALLREYARETGIPVEPIGALLVAWNEAQGDALAGIAANADRNGYRRAARVDAATLYREEPHLAPGALAALAVPDEGIVCPFTTPLAFATDAVLNGARLRLGSPVTGGARTADGTHALATPGGTVHARWVVNAAGLHADAVDRLFGHARFTVRPRRGELIVFDKLARGLVRHILLPVPTSVSKGVLVSPTVFGNVVLGPTAEDVPDPHDTATTAAGLAGLLAQGRRILPALLDEEVTAVYAGLRAATEESDYRIFFDHDGRYVCVGGIRSTGLTASMAIAEHVREGLADAGLALRLRDDLRSVRMPAIGEACPRPYQSPDAIAADPDCGRIVCHCERVTRAEILAATRTPIPARTLDAIRRRTRALFGRCQGFYCAAEVAALLAGATGQDVETLLHVPPA